MEKVVYEFIRTICEYYYKISLKAKGKIENAYFNNIFLFLSDMKNFVRESEDEVDEFYIRHHEEAKMMKDHFMTQFSKFEKFILDVNPEVYRKILLYICAIKCDADLLSLIIFLEYIFEELIKYKYLNFINNIQIYLKEGDEIVLENLKN